MSKNLTPKQELITIHWIVDKGVAKFTVEEINPKNCKNEGQTRQ